jgi:hypothetical protein
MVARPASCTKDRGARGAHTRSSMHAASPARGVQAGPPAHSNAINLRIPPEPGALHFREF